MRILISLVSFFLPFMHFYVYLIGLVAAYFSSFAFQGPAERLFGEKFYALMKSALKEDGLLCVQGSHLKLIELWFLLGLYNDKFLYAGNERYRFCNYICRKIVIY